MAGAGFVIEKRADRIVLTGVLPWFEFIAADKICPAGTYGKC